jgi:hypothetical protein
MVFGGGFDNRGMAKLNWLNAIDQCHQNQVCSLNRKGAPAVERSINF